MQGGEGMDNLISRKAAIKAIKELQDCYNGFSDTYDKACIIGVLKELPPAPPKIGKWIKNGNKYTCPFCGTGFTTVSEEVRSAHKYCYYCGAKMEGE